jgi:hypothetical protein
MENKYTKVDGSFVAHPAAGLHWAAPETERERRVESGRALNPKLWMAAVNARAGSFSHGAILPQ